MYKHWYEKIFSVKNDTKTCHKILTILGIKLKFKYSKVNLNELEEKVNYIYKKGGQLYLSQLYKINNILEYAEYYKCDTFIETGTFYGSTTNRVKDYFKNVYTIELSEKFFTLAQEKFKECQNVHCLQGNSKDILPTVINSCEIENPIFWLDAHYSACGTARAEDCDTPILNELEIILNKYQKCVILIDDAREFGTDKDYPSKFKIKNFIKHIAQNAEIEIYDDIIRVILK